jgi:hypothetical protein
MNRESTFLDKLYYLCETILIGVSQCCCDIETELRKPYDVGDI